MIGKVAKEAYIHDTKADRIIGNKKIATDITNTNTQSNIQGDDNNNRDEAIRILYPTYNCKSIKSLSYSKDVATTKRKQEEINVFRKFERKVNQDEHTITISKCKTFAKEKNALKIVALPIVAKQYRNFHDAESKTADSKLYRNKM